MDLIKKLTGKNPQDYEKAASHIINNIDVKAFKTLVEQDEFLFDFIKINVAQRLKKACNQNNYKNLLKFLKYYSSFYDEFIAETLAKYADEDLTDELLSIFENGTDEQRAYCAKYFSFIQDTLAIEFLRKHSYSEFEPLAANCAKTLAIMKDETSFLNAVKKLKSDDEFEKLAAINFLTNYQDKRALPLIFDAMKTSTMSEHIASSIPYITPFLELLNTNYEDILLALNYILNGLGEIVSISQIFDFQLYEIFDTLINSKISGKSAIVLLTAKNKFNQLTENEEYIYDEDKNTKNEVFEIKNLLNNYDLSEFENYIEEELKAESNFVYSALDLINDAKLARPLLKTQNPTIILKALDTIKNLGHLNQADKDLALENIKDETIKSIIKAM